MNTTDALLARYQAESEERSTFIDGILEAAEKETRDLTSQELELLTRTRERMQELSAQIEPLRTAAQINRASRDRTAEIAAQFASARGEPARSMEYRSAGEYALDMWRAGVGDASARDRLDLFQRAASHQTTADNPGLIPTPIIGPVVSFIDTNRSLVTQLGPRQLPGQTWSRPKITQHSSVAAQTGEKVELVSQKLTITKLTGTATTYGGYVNVSRQNIDFTQPGVMDIVITDLAGEYAVQTEAAACTTFDTASTAGIPIATGAATAAGVSTSLWDAASKIYTATKGQGRLFAICGPDMLPVLAPVFPPVNPMNAISPGLSASDMGSGLVGSVSGIPLYVSAGIGALRILVFSTAAAEVYEDRIGSLQVVEPSVLGIQVAYAGYFSPLTIDAGGIVKIVKTP